LFLVRLHPAFLCNEDGRRSDPVPLQNPVDRRGEQMSPLAIPLRPEDIAYTFRPGPHLILPPPFHSH